MILTVVINSNPFGQSSGGANRWLTLIEGIASLGSKVNLLICGVFSSIEEKVFWMKEYSRDQIPNIICNADLLVLPRPDSKQAQGGLTTKLGEYLATGKLVCATKVGEIPDYLTDNESVFFAEPGSVESFTQAIGSALSDYDNAIRVGANARMVAEEHFNKDV